MSDLTFYRTRCNDMRKAAEEATLANVQERCERAAAAFAELAERAERSEKTRERERVRRAEAGLTAT